MTHHSPPDGTTSPRRRWPAWRRALAVCWVTAIAIPRVVWRTLLVLYFIVAVTCLLVRYVALPQVGAHRAEIAEALSQSLGVRVEISQLHADWSGLRPELHIGGLRLLDDGGRVALAVPAVDATLDWSSLWRRRIVTRSLALTGPQLSIRREADGAIYVAGLRVDGGGQGGDGFSRFVLGQEHIDISQAKLSWLDLQRGAPQLDLTDVALRLMNDGDRHRVALRASPPSIYAAPLDLRADLRGESFSDLNRWHGTAYVSLERADLAAWQQWVDYPFELPRGKGGVHAWIDFDGRTVAGVTADVALRDVSLRLASDLPELALTALSGRLRGSMRAGERSFSAERLQLTTVDGLQAAPSRLSVRSVAATDKVPARLELEAADIDLATLRQLSGYVPTTDSLRQTIAETEPSGHLSTLALNWQAAGEDAAKSPMRFKTNARFEKVSIHPRGRMPGVEGLSGMLEGDERGGTFALTLAGGLHLPAEMQQPFLPLQQATLNGSWGHHTVAGADTLFVQLRDAQIRNEDAAGTVNGEWLATGQSGRIDLTGRFTRARASAVWRYMPLSVPQSVTDWLHGNLLDGQIQDISLRLAGDLAHFPFRNDPQGTFRVQGRLANVKLDFAPGWPGLDAVRGTMLFDRTRMLIQAESGRYGAARVANVKVEIPDLEDVGKQVLTVDGRAAGPTKDFLDYVNASRLADLSGHFSRQTVATGNGDLELHLAVPLHDSHATTVQGAYSFTNNQIRLFPSLPEFRNTTAQITFTEHGLGMPSMTSEFFGAPLHATGTTGPDGTLRFDGSATMTTDSLRQIYDVDVWSYLKGPLVAHVAVTVHKGLAEVSVTSSLEGVASTLPAPLAKSAGEAMPTTLTWRNAGLADTAPPGGTQSWRLRIADRGEAAWEEDCTDASCRFLRGAVAINDRVTLPSRGLRLSGRFQRLDVDAWKPVVLAASKEGPAAGTEIATGATVQADEVVAAGHMFHKVTGRVLRRGENYVVRLDGPDVAGDIAWQGQGKGSMQARFSRLALQPVKGESAATSEAAARSSLPAFDVAADDFSVQGIDLGRLQLRATNNGDEWRLDQLSVDSDDAHMTGTGIWRPFGARRLMTLDFKLQSDDAGKLLTRLGYPDSMRGGKTDVEGVVSWRGPPAAIDYPTLSGQLKINVEKGQFSKLDPGAGRLLGILSLQSLPRRLTLDFTDVFSEGFAFDTLHGQTSIRNGVMSTDDLEIRGPAARVTMTGSTDVAHETHDIKVVVQPTLSETVAIGAAAVTGIINPLVGLATYVAQKVLQDPVEKIFSFEYAITGSWSEPKMERLHATMESQAENK